MRRSYIIAFLIVLFFAGYFSLGYSKEDFLNLQVHTKIVKGKVVYIDQVSSKITIKVKQGKEEEELSFAITEKTKVIRNEVYVSFADILKGDEVIIEYYDNPKLSGPYIANYIELIVQ